MKWPQSIEAFGLRWAVGRQVEALGGETETRFAVYKNAEVKAELHMTYGGEEGFDARLCTTSRYVKLEEALGALELAARNAYEKLAQTRFQ